MIVDFAGKIPKLVENHSMFNRVLSSEVGEERTIKDPGVYRAKGKCFDRGHDWMSPNLSLDPVKL